MVIFYGGVAEAAGHSFDQNNGFLHMNQAYIKHTRITSHQKFFVEFLI